MSDPYMSQIHMTGFNFAPRNYAKCDGQLLAINQYQALFSLLYTMYGGDGRTTFGLPDLRGRTPTYFGGAVRQGMSYGFEKIVLNTNNLPHHTHQAQATTNDGQGSGRAPIFGKLLAKGTTARMQYRNSLDTPVALNSASLEASGGDGWHDNMQPSTVINFIIALQGAYPSRN
ncbi:MAG: tail fiber protein [Nitrospinota bacterium]|nr:tail fiber protein [Nitrospinota bacterium]